MDDIYAGFDLPDEHGKREQPSEPKEGEKTENKAAASLDAELAQAMQSLGTVGTQLTSFWGSFRKTSTSAYNASVKELETRTEAAKKDFAPYVSKAREELTKFGEQARNSAAAGQAASVAPPPSSDTPEQEPTVSFYGEVLPPSNNSAAENNLNAAAFFKSLSSTIQHNPNIAKLQQNLSTNPNLKNFQKGFSSFQQSSQEAFKHPEEFMSKAGKYLNSAVAIVPPKTTEEKGKMREEKMQEVLGRKQGLVHQLQTNVAILLVDPNEADGNAEWNEFLKGVEAQGGMQGETWQKKIEEEMKESAAISKTLQTLVPEKLPADVFWSRYFFRVQQIEQDEARRKQVLETAAAQSEDDFSWDMEDEDTPVSPSAVDRSTPTLKPAEAEPESPTIEKFSARNSSEEGTESSYALVSGPPSTAASEKGEPKAVEKVEGKKEDKVEKKAEESDEDSDWE